MNKLRLVINGVIPHLPSGAAVQAGLMWDLHSLIKTGDAALSLWGIVVRHDDIYNEKSLGTSSPYQQ